jgi:hypothetical protein
MSITTMITTVGARTDMLVEAYRELFAAIAECAATLSGLLFVAMTVVGRQRPADRPAVVGQVRAAASIVVFSNALTVSLFGLVPGDNAGYAAVVMAVIGILFTAAGTRSIFSGSMARRHIPRQIALLTILLVTFAFELAAGIDLIASPRSAGAAELVSNLLIVLLIIGVARAWELVGDRDTRAIASIAVLAGHDLARTEGPHPDSDATARSPETGLPAQTGGREQADQLLHG